MKKVVFTPLDQRISEILSAWPIDVNIYGRESVTGGYTIFLDVKGRTWAYWGFLDKDLMHEAVIFLSGILDVAQNAPDLFWEEGTDNDKENIPRLSASIAAYAESELTCVDLDAVMEERFGDRIIFEISLEESLEEDGNDSPLLQ